MEPYQIVNDYQFPSVAAKELYEKGYRLVAVNPGGDEYKTEYVWELRLDPIKEEK